MKKFYLFLIGFMLCGVINAQDTPPAGTPVISLTTTTAGASVRIKMQAKIANTSVWIKTAPNTYMPVTVDTIWTDFTNYTPTGTSLKVYGNLIGFDCSGANLVNKGSVSTLDASGNTSLQELYCSYNRLTSLDVQGLTQLNTLYCFDNQLTSLNVQGLMQLNTLYCFGNQLTSLNVQGLTQLQILLCSDNQLQSLEIQGLTQLQVLRCYYNRLTSLNVQGLTQLNDLWCSYNQLTSLDVQGLTQLNYLYCDNNQLQSLDVQGLTQLNNLYCYNNQLTSLNVQGLTQLKILRCYYNPCTSTTLGLDWLYCQLPERQPDDNAKIYVSEKKQANLEAFVLATDRTNANSKNWKVYSAGNYEITNTTGTYVCGSTLPAGTPVIELTTTTAGATVRMRMQAAAANTPVWIETAPNTFTLVTVGTSRTDFTNYTPTGTSLKVYGAIIHFDCDGESNENRNPVSAIDASGNTGVQTLYCFGNQLTSLNVQGLTQLQTLSCSYNQLTSLNLQGLTQLQTLYCNSNQLTSLDVQGLTQLQTLRCHYNQLTSLNVQGLTQLQGLSCSNNQLTSLNTQGLMHLIYLGCYYNQLTSLDVQGLTQLQNLWCSNNQLTSLNVQDLTLVNLGCSNNQLQSLDVQSLTQLIELHCYNNPCTSTTLDLDRLYCQLPERQPADNAKIYVSNINQINLEAFVLATNRDNANSKNWKVFSSYGYEITNTTGTYVCGTGIEAVKSTVGIYPNPASNNITVETEAFGSAITITDLLGRTVMTATATATKTTLNISSLTAGTYVVRVGDRMAKVVKM